MCQTDVMARPLRIKYGAQVAATLVRASSLTMTRRVRFTRIACLPNKDEPIVSGMISVMAPYEQIYQAVRIYEYTLNEVSDFLGLYYSTISVIAKRVAQVKRTPRMKT
jgi:uncharacterized SAM-binding protein YcdF (DUF218 family)